MMRKNKNDAIAPRSEETQLATPRLIHDPHAWFAEMDRWFDKVRRDFLTAWGLSPLPPGAGPSPLGVRQPPVDLIDEGQDFVLRTELPGVAKEDVDLNVTADAMELRAETSREREEQEKDYYYSERRYQALHRILPFPAEVRAEQAQATLKDGILEVRVPKKEPTPEAKPVKVRVE